MARKMGASADPFQVQHVAPRRRRQNFADQPTIATGSSHFRPQKTPHQAGILSAQHNVAQADFFFGAAFLAAAGLAAADLTVVDLVTVGLAPTTAGVTVCARELP